MKFFITYLFFCIAFFSRAQSPFTGVRASLQSGDYEIARNVLDSCTAAKYEEDSVSFYKGLLNLKKGNIKWARKLCNDLQKSYPDFTEAHYLSGLIYFLNENYGSSIDEFTIVLKNNPNHLKALYNRSLAYGLLEDYASAIAGLDKCIALSPDYSMAYYSRAYWYEYTGNYAEAKKDYEHSILLDPKNYDAYFGLAYVYKNQKENDKACETITRAISAGSQIAEELKENFCR